MEKINKNTTLEKVLQVKGGEEILRKHGLPCVSCPMAAMEMKFLKLGEVCERYGIGVEEVVNELNEKMK